MAREERLSQRLGLDYLVEPASSQASSEAPDVSSLEALASARILTTVRDLASRSQGAMGGVRLRMVSETTGMDASVLVPLTRRLARLDLIKVVAPDSFGDDGVELTDHAEELLKATDQGDLLKELAL